MQDGIHVNFTNKQQKQVKVFRDSHFCEEFKKNSGGFGSTSKLSFIVGSTSIGGTLKILCPYCGHKEDITDIDTW